MSEKHIVFTSLGIWKPYEGTTRYDIQSIDDAKNIIKTVKYHNTANFLCADICKSIYTYDTTNIMKNNNLETLHTNNCSHVPGKLRICRQKARKNKSNSTPNLTFVYELSSDYYVISQKIQHDDFRFIITDKLQYTSDIEKCFPNKHIINNNPSKAYNLSQWLPDTHPDVPCGWYTLTDKYCKDNVYLYEFGDQIVVDKNTNQIWPTQTQQVPVELVQIFNKPTEKIR